MLEQDNQGYFITLNQFDKELSQVAKQTVIRLDQKPTDIISSAYNNGAIDLLIANQSHFPLTHIRIHGDDIASTQINLPGTELLEQDDDILFHKLNTRFHQNPQGSISLVLKDSPSSDFLTAVVIDTTDATHQIKMSRRYPLPQFMVDDKDNLTMVKTFTIDKARGMGPECLEFITIFCFDDTLYVFDEPKGMYTVETPENTDMDNINLILDHHCSAFLIIPNKFGGFTTELIYSPFPKI